MRVDCSNAYPAAQNTRSRASLPLLREHAVDTRNFALDTQRRDANDAFFRTRKDTHAVSVTFCVYHALTLISGTLPVGLASA